MDKENLKKIKEEMNQFLVDGKFTVLTELKWLESKNAIKIYRDGSYGIVFPEYRVQNEFLEQFNNWQRKIGYAKKMQELEHIEMEKRNMTFVN